MRRISVDTSYDAPEVELWGHVFVVREVTKSLARKLAPFEDKWNTADDNEDVLDALLFVLDQRLIWTGYEQPADDASAGHRFAARVVGPRKVAPSRLIRKMYDADRVSIARVLGLMNDLGEADLPN